MVPASIRLTAVALLMGLALPARAESGTVKSVEAGPISSADDAKTKCPPLCAPPSKWNGAWRTTVLGKMSVCDCEQPPAAMEFNPAAFHRMTTQWQGDEKSLDVVNDGKNNQLQLAPTGNKTGQFWKITPLGDGWYRLTTKWQGDDKSLDVVNDGKNNNKLQLAPTGKKIGQYWKIVKQ